MRLEEGDIAVRWLLIQMGSFSPGTRMLGLSSTFAPSESLLVSQRVVAYIPSLSAVRGAGSPLGAGAGGQTYDWRAVSCPVNGQTQPVASASSREVI